MKVCANLFAIVSIYHSNLLCFMTVGAQTEYNCQKPSRVHLKAKNP